MSDGTVFIKFADFTSEKVRQYGGAAFDLTKSSFSFCRDRIDGKKILESVCRMAFCCKSKVAYFQSETRVYLRPENLDPLLHQICKQILLQDKTFNVVLLEKWRYRSKTLSLITCPNKVATYAANNCQAAFKDLLAAIIWHEFNHIPDSIHAVDGKLKTWNKRVNEKELLQKLGSPTSWDIFYDDQDEEGESVDMYDENIEMKQKEIDSVNVMEKVALDVKLQACNDHLQNVEDFKKHIMGAGDTPLTREVKQPQFNTVCNKQRKRNSVLTSIKKIFKPERTQPTIRTNNIRQEPGECSDMYHAPFNSKTIKNSSTCREETDMPRFVRGKEKPGPVLDKQTNAHEQEDVDRNSLMIHIPGNVQKIVLVKDGHKIKIEI